MNKVILYYLLIFVAIFFSCNPAPSQQKFSNHLINESSPYLKQHAHNPVNWYPWGEEALKRAKEENKPILVSIGYSSCHWCHVMEHESFEDTAVARVMNENFISIKIDREERPDIDQVYMDAIHAMGQQGGWPLNVFLTPDKEPFYGGTYFPKEQWTDLLTQVSNAYKLQPNKIKNSATALKEHIAKSELERYDLGKENNQFPLKKLEKAYKELSKGFDYKNGGFNKSPKFPMPKLYEFLLQYSHITNDKAALDHTLFTLDKIKNGGIYDQIGGGFSRYSVDEKWFAPHFEKMLYDNGQLLSLYANAYRISKNNAYKKVISETIQFLKREMLHKNGGFYAALDADSEEKEGKFYVWTYQELQKYIPEDQFPLFTAYYNIEKKGNWEHGNNILYKKVNDNTFVKTHSLESKDFEKLTIQWKKILLKNREKRIRPGLDNKIISGWNGLALKGICDAYSATNEKEFLELALTNATFIKEKMILKDDQLLRTYDTTKKINGYLEDYAAVIDGFISLYQITFDEKWLTTAIGLTEYAYSHFYDEKENMFFYTDNSSEKLIAKKKELFDNVIPSSNSMMATNLFILGHILGDEKYIERSDQMLAIMNDLMMKNIQFSSYWASLYISHIKPTVEIAIVGKQSLNYAQEIASNYYPNKVILGTKNHSDLALLKERSAINGKTTLYVCRNKTCNLPVFEIDKAWKEIIE
ncbi:thioredoxin domain-containing protein [Flammeovirga pectinis]|uniref:Thioredoxin domain-containing protein n=1 Tax=Flammeovirga pectinis TaxID=2494373 RepID=A0A3S9P8B2_9BACT|nr:thioredoxin domain-containing protein [Flammeovirga pectinis]AZQ64436.1 thioredoxin domain-containing protein [Flammeovirga pectinis]